MNALLTLLARCLLTSAVIFFLTYAIQSLSKKFEVRIFTKKVLNTVRKRLNANNFLFSPKPQRYIGKIHKLSPKLRIHERNRG